MGFLKGIYQGLVLKGSRRISMGFLRGIYKGFYRFRGSLRGSTRFYRFMEFLEGIYKSFYRFRGSLQGSIRVSIGLGVTYSLRCSSFVWLTKFVF